MNDKIVCQKCIYYYVTWLNTTPHGCKAYGFKSKIIPSVVVKNTSSQECMFYKIKNINN